MRAFSVTCYFATPGDYAVQFCLLCLLGIFVWQKSLKDSKETQGCVFWKTQLNFRNLFTYACIRYVRVTHKLQVLCVVRRGDTSQILDSIPNHVSVGFPTTIEMEHSRVCVRVDVAPRTSGDIEGHMNVQQLLSPNSLIDFRIVQRLKYGSLPVQPNVVTNNAYMYGVTCESFKPFKLKERERDREREKERPSFLHACSREKTESRLEPTSSLSSVSLLA